MPESFDPAWEYYAPDPYVEYIIGSSAALPARDLIAGDEAFGGGIVRGPGHGATKPRGTSRAQCVICRKWFDTLSLTRTCSVECRVIQADRTRSAKGVRLIPYRCSTCRVIAASPSGRRRYCSVNCNPYTHCGRKPAPAEELSVTLEEAKQLVADHGVRYGDVFPLLPEGDREPFREWFLHAPGLPNLAARDPAPPSPNGELEDDDPPAVIPITSARASGYTGDVCQHCQGSRMVRSGACLRCEDCGQTTGCG